jgi:hypothetical protein
LTNGNACNSEAGRGQRADTEPHVEQHPQACARLDPLLLRHELGDHRDERRTATPFQRPDNGRERVERPRGTDQRIAEIRQRRQEKGEAEQLARAKSVGDHAEHHGGNQPGETGDGQADPDLDRAQADDDGQVQGRATDEHAVAERVDQVQHAKDAGGAAGQGLDHGSHGRASLLLCLLALVT